MADTKAGSSDSPTKVDIDPKGKSGGTGSHKTAGKVPPVDAPKRAPKPK